VRIRFGCGLDSVVDLIRVWIRFGCGLDSFVDLILVWIRFGCGLDSGVDWIREYTVFIIKRGVLDFIYT